MPSLVAYDHWAIGIDRLGGHKLLGYLRAEPRLTEAFRHNERPRRQAASNATTEPNECPISTYVLSSICSAVGSNRNCIGSFRPS